MNKLYKQIQFSDGFIFYEQENGVYTDSKNEKDCDMSFKSWKEIKNLINNDTIEITSIKYYKK